MTASHRLLDAMLHAASAWRAPWWVKGAVIVGVCALFGLFVE